MGIFGAVFSKFLGGKIQIFARITFRVKFQVVTKEYFSEIFLMNRAMILYKANSPKT